MLFTLCWVRVRRGGHHLSLVFCFFVFLPSQGDLNTKVSVTGDTCVQARRYSCFLPAALGKFSCTKTVEEPCGRPGTGRVPFHRDATATSHSVDSLYSSPLSPSLLFFTLSIAPLRLKKGHFWSHKERDSFTPPQAEGMGRRRGGGREGWRVRGEGEGRREEAQHNVFYMKGRG